MIYPKHTPEIIKPLGKHLTFDIPNDSNEIYLTFDDGPHPSITPLVLDQLKVYDAKATFFLIGNHFFLKLRQFILRIAVDLM